MTLDAYQPLRKLIMNEALSLNLPFPAVDAPTVPLITVDDKIVGSGYGVSLMRSKVREWDAEAGSFVHKFFVSIDITGDNDLVWISSGDSSLEGAVVVYNRCSDHQFG